MNAATAMRLSVLVTIVTLLFVPAHANDECDPDNQVSAIRARPGWTLSGPFSVEQLEAENMITIRETGIVLPFGYENKEWETMKAAMKPGDQIYHLVVSEGRFHAEYHVLVRDGCVIRSLRGIIT